MKRLLSASAQSCVTAGIQGGFNKHIDVWNFFVEVL